MQISLRERKPDAWNFSHEERFGVVMRRFFRSKMAAGKVIFASRKLQSQSVGPASISTGLQSSPEQNESKMVSWFFSESNFSRFSSDAGSSDAKPFVSEVRPQRSPCRRSSRLCTFPYSQLPGQITAHILEI